MKSYDAAIIGAGPAGIAAAIQLKRYGIDTILFEHDKVGGLLRSANLVENYPGFPDGISGVGLVELMQKQLETNAIITVFETVKSVDFHGKVYFTLTTNKREIKTQIVIIATGTKPRTLDLPGFEETHETSIFYEVYPLSHVKDKKIAIIGAGDAAFDYALNLSTHNQVTINNRNVNTICLPLLWDRALRNQNIKYREISVLERVNRNKNGLELWWKHGERPVANDSTKYEKGEFGVHPEQSGCTPNSIFQRNSFKKELVDYLLIAIGREPVLEFLSENVKTHLDDLEKGGLLYLIGDVKNSLFRQASIAAGDGVKAAMKANLRLNELKYI